jgi:hypothetical protein
MRVVLIVAAGLCLAGCSSTDFFKPPQVTLQMDSTPPGADAVTSIGPGCKTPCSVQVPADKNFTVTYTLAKYEPATVEVTVVKQSGSDPILDPNPAVVELVAVTPPKKPKRKPHHAKPKAAAPAAQPAAPAAAAAPPPPGLSPFPPVR